MMKMAIGLIATFSKVGIALACFGFGTAVGAQTLNYSGPVTAQNGYLSFEQYLTAPGNSNSSVVFTGGNLTFNFTAPQLEPFYNDSASYGDQVTDYGPGIPFRHVRWFNIYDNVLQSATVTLGQTDFSGEAPFSVTTTNTNFMGWFLTAERCNNPFGAFAMCQYYIGFFDYDVVAHSGGAFSIIVPLSGSILDSLNTRPWQMALTLAQSNNNISLSGIQANMDYNWVEGASPPNSPVPEPASWGLMLTGFLVVGFSMRHRRRQFSDIV